MNFNYKCNSDVNTNTNSQFELNVMFYGPKSGKGVGAGRHSTLDKVCSGSHWAPRLQRYVTYTVPIWIHNCVTLWGSLTKHLSQLNFLVDSDNCKYNHVTRSVPGDIRTVTCEKYAGRSIGRFLPITRLYVVQPSTIGIPIVHCVCTVPVVDPRWTNEPQP